MLFPPFPNELTGNNILETEGVLYYKALGMNIHSEGYQQIYLYRIIFAYLTCGAKSLCILLLCLTIKACLGGEEAGPNHDDWEGK
jgi:hypothetical protein